MKDMTMRATLFAGSALALVLAGPAMAQQQQQQPGVQQQGQQAQQTAVDCDLQLTELEQQIENLSPEVQQDLQPLLERARQLVESQNVEDVQACLDVIAEVEAVVVEEGGQPVQRAQQQQPAEGAEAEGAEILVEQPQPQVLVRQQPPQVTIRQQQPVVTVRQAEPLVTVRVPEPQVTVRVPEPEIIVRMPEPIVEVQMPEPEVAVEMPQPEVSVEMPQPEVEIAQAQPDVQVRMAQPQVQVEQPQPEVEVEQAQAMVQVEEAQAQVQFEQAEPQVQVEQAQARVQLEQAQPQVQVEQAEPQVRFERMQQAAGAQQQQGQQQQQATALQQEQVEGDVAEAPAVGQTELELAPEREGEPVAVVEEEQQADVQVGALQQDPEDMPLMTLRTEDVIGAEVIGARGDEIAEIERVVRSVQDGQYYAVMEVGGFLGIGERTVAIPLDAFDVGPNNEILLEQATEEDLENMAPYDEGLYEEAALQG